MGRSPTTPSQDGLRLEYLGHAAFRWTTQSGARILIDPFGDPYEPRPAPSYGTPSGSRWFLHPFPAVEADVLLVTHPHFDHDAVHRVAGTPSIIRGPMSLTGPDYSVTGYLGQHAGPYGQEFGKRNIVYVIDAGGIRLCHVGDNQAELPAEVLVHAGSIDLLMLPVDDGCHLLTFDEVAQVIETLAPRVVVPVHYHIDTITDHASTLGPIDAWLSSIGTVRRWAGTAHQVSSAALPEAREVWVFDTCLGPSPTEP